ncbi:hypothetical protein DB345_15300 [Spartobacteria bacterium LR76]|nr:hypothetical protein DB345_15300 [Spartobacteria bacterium LR76]
MIDLLRWLSLCGLVSFSLLPSARACGPFFPDTILNDPGATLRSPIVNFENEIAKIPSPFISPQSAPVLRYSPDKSVAPHESLSRKTLSLEVEELADILRELPPDQRARSLEEYTALRAAFLEKFPLRIGESTDLTVPASGKTLLSEAERGKWPDHLPLDIQMYLQGAILYNTGNKPKAIEVWKDLLALPEDQRRNRSVAAAWMIARATRETDSQEAAKPWYRTCADLSTRDFRDCLQLGLSSLGWEARSYLAKGEYRKALELYHRQAMAGDPSAADSLLIAIPSIDKLSDQDLQQWVQDPFLRGLLTAKLLRETYNWWDFASRPENDSPKRWLNAIEQSASSNITEASTLAELAYSSGDFDIAKRWLLRAPKNDPLALWLTAKFDFMEGRPAAAEKSLTAALPAFQHLPKSTGSTLIISDVCMIPASTAAEYRLNQFYGDLGAANLANDRYAAAMDNLYMGNWDLDAAYVAERVLTLPELLSHVRVSYAAPTASRDSTDWKIRYILARRLARDGYFRDARPFFPKEYLPVFDHYVSLMKQSKAALPVAERSSALWEVAEIHRSLGLELFGTEGQPDFAWADGMFPATNFIYPRLGLSFALPPATDYWERPAVRNLIPAPTEQERARVEQTRLLYEHRFQYRYIAADLAWNAARLMPDNSEETARILGIAGTWLANRAPEAADRFYKAMIWRNWSTPLAREADQRRWFPHIEWDYDPWAAAGAKAPDYERW